MTNVMMTLGKFRFSLGTAAYENLRRSSAFRWPAQERAGRRPARQFTGPGDETIDLDGVVYPHQPLGAVPEESPAADAGLGALKRLRSDAQDGQPLLLTDGTGNNWGKWCLRRVEETQSVFFADGTPRKVKFRLSLSRYGEDA